MELSKTATSKINTASKKGAQPFFSFGQSPAPVSFFKPKLTINQPNDPYEQEADAMAEKVMQMTVPAMQRKCASCEQEDEKKVQLKPITVIQKQDETDPPVSPPATPPSNFQLPMPSLLQPLTQPDFLAMRQPFFQRNIFHLWDPGSALQVWNYNFDFFRRFGLSLDLSASASNFTAPFFIDSQLKAGNQTWWEITDRDMGTTSFSAALPILDFNADFSPTKPSWFKTLFGGSSPSVHRKCDECETGEENNVQLKENGGQSQTSDGFENYVGGLDSSGEQLPADVRNFYEPRFGYDFSNVKIHNDAAAAASAKSINALAYTTGTNIVFGDGQYAPGDDSGKRLLGHELTHVVQQGGNDHISNVARFSDTDHHVLEEVALSAVFSEEELAAIEHGNMQRDYSQLPGAAVQVLVGEPRAGSYEKHEHFDNFIYDREKGHWVSHGEYDKIWDENTKEWVPRKIPVKAGDVPKITPLQYIEAELQAAVKKDMPDKSSFTHIGNAFHTIEDFFAHSNFVELTKGDFSSGKELTTHASGVPGASSEDSILSNVSDPASAAFYAERFMADKAKASAVSHGFLAKDYHSNSNHSMAITLAALVIRQTGVMLKNAFSLKTEKDRNGYVQETIVKTLNRYLQPPGDKDKWWETILSEDNGNTARGIKELQDKTPVTVNQQPGSPLRAFEATKFSSWKAIGLGTSVSIPLKSGTFFTAGFMISLPGTGTTIDDKTMFAPPHSERGEPGKPPIIFGAQISGSFDVSDLFK